MLALATQGGNPPRLKPNNGYKRIIQNVGDESAGQPRSSNAFQRAFHRGTCWMFTPEQRFHLGREKEGITNPDDYRRRISSFNSHFFNTGENCRKTRMPSFHTETHRGRLSIHSSVTTIFQRFSLDFFLLLFPKTNANTFPRNPYHRSTAN